jgi:hypothetical protein
MQALRDVPYPSASPDPSLFESWSNEYNKVRLPRVSRAPRPTGGVAFTRRANTGHNASGVLEQLSRDGKFAEAEEIRQELVANGHSHTPQQCLLSCRPEYLTPTSLATKPHGDVCKLAISPSRLRPRQ